MQNPKKSSSLIRFTPIGCGLLILIGIAVVVAFNGLFINNKGGSSLGGGIALMFSFFLIGLFFLEQWLTRLINAPLLKIWMIELVIIAALTALAWFTNYNFSIG